MSTLSGISKQEQAHRALCRVTNLCDECVDYIIDNTASGNDAPTEELKLKVETNHRLCHQSGSCQFEVIMLSLRADATRDENEVLEERNTALQTGTLYVHIHTLPNMHCEYVT